jgi:hypothetical protein
MRRTTLAAIAVLLALALPSTAAAAQAKPSSGVRGTVLDTTCETGCQPECPPPPTCRAAAVVPCPQGASASIVCPLLQAPEFCTQAGCPPPPTETPDFPPYAGSAGSVLVRRAGSERVLGRVPVAGGKFTAHLVPGRYVLRAHVAEPCWTGNRQVVEIEKKRWIPLVLRVSNGCVVHPDS